MFVALLDAAHPVCVVLLLLARPLEQRVRLLLRVADSCVLVSEALGPLSVREVGALARHTYDLAARFVPGLRGGGRSLLDQNFTHCRGLGDCHDLPRYFSFTYT